MVARQTRTLQICPRFFLGSGIEYVRMIHMCACSTARDRRLFWGWCFGDGESEGRRPMGGQRPQSGAGGGAKAPDEGLGQPSGVGATSTTDIRTGAQALPGTFLRRRLSGCQGSNTFVNLDKAGWVNAAGSTQILRMSTGYILMCENGAQYF